MSSQGPPTKASCVKVGFEPISNFESSELNHDKNWDNIFDENESQYDKWN